MMFSTPITTRTPQSLLAEFRPASRLERLFSGLNLLYHQGTARHQEDLIVVNSSAGIAGVLDGTSEPFVPSGPTGGPMLYDKLTGGQLAVQVAAEIISAAGPTEPLKDVILRANSRLTPGFIL